MLVTDLALLGYWVATMAGWITVGEERFLNEWNFSFLILDVSAIGTGLASVVLSLTQRSGGYELMLVSLALTFAAGIMALNFYLVRGTFELEWWLPNLWLTLFPVIGIALLLGTCHKRA